MSRTSHREQLLAAFRRQREEPDTPERIAQRAATAVELRKVAETWEPFGPEAQGARALLLAWDTTQRDHVAVAIAAHKLLARATIADIEAIGQTEPANMVLLGELCAYLDGEGYAMGSNGQWIDRSDPRELRSLFGDN